MDDRINLSNGVYRIILQSFHRGHVLKPEGSCGDDSTAAKVIEFEKEVNYLQTELSSLGLECMKGMNLSYAYIIKLKLIPYFQHR
jgi:hypothetical protein